MSKENGGPAYPSANSIRMGDMVSGGHSGMSLRDYFAAKFAAAQATATSADSNFINPDYVDQRDGRSVAQKIAENSYALADAMLKERSK